MIALGMKAMVRPVINIRNPAKKKRPHLNMNVAKT